MEPSLSFVIPICDRTLLLRETLDAYSQQAGLSQTEFVIVDDGGTDTENLLQLLEMARTTGFDIRYFRLDVSRLPFPVYQYNGLLNDPGPALNVGIKKARAPRVVLTSPEIKPLCQTCVNSLLGWPLPPKHGLICDVWDPDLHMWISGGPDRRALHFLAMFNKADLLATGGFDERFVVGWGFQDTEFRDRFSGAWGGTFLFSGSQIKAWHQSHPRVENFARDGSVQRAKELYNSLSGQAVANVGHEWGNDNLIVEERWTD